MAGAQLERWQAPPSNYEVIQNFLDRFNADRKAKEAADLQRQQLAQQGQFQQGQLDVQRGQLGVQQSEAEVRKRAIIAKNMLDGWQARMSEGDPTVQQEAAAYVKDHPEDAPYLQAAAMYHASQGQQAQGVAQGKHLQDMKTVAAGGTDPNATNVYTHDVTGAFMPNEGFQQQQAVDLQARGGGTKDTIPKPTGNAVTDLERRATSAMTTAPQNMQQQTAITTTGMEQAGAMQRQKVASAASKSAQSEGEGAAIAAEIIAGRQPPVIQSRTLEGPVRAALAASQYDLTKARQDWDATQKYLSTLNGAGQVRLRQAVDFAYESLGVVKDLSAQWDAGGFPLLNSARLRAAKEGVLGPKAQEIATKLDSQIVEMQSELSVVYRGGNSPTDEAMKQAAKVLQSNWSKQTLAANIGLLETNLQIRRNSIISAGAAAGAGNKYQPNVTLAPPKGGSKSNSDPLGLFN